MKGVIGLYRRNGKNVYIRQPEYEELSFVAKLWADKETMQDIGGVFNFPESKWSMFYKKMIYPTDGKNFYCLVYTNADEAVGEVSFHGYDSATKIARFNVKIHSKHRNSGYGEEAVRLLLEYYFLEFGGDMIMDNITTEEGKKVAAKLGFKAIRQYKNETAIKITRNEFLDHKQFNIKNIAIVVYSGMNLADYALTLDVINKANEIEGKKILNVYEVAFEESIITEEKIVLTSLKKVSEVDKPDILFITSGQTPLDEKIINFILSNFNNCEYILAQGSGVNLLIESKSLDGIVIPSKQVESLEEESSKYRLQDSNFVDNGKIMLSANRVGQIEMLLNLINKVGGSTLASEVSKKLGK